MILFWLACTAGGDKPNKPIDEEPEVPERCLGFEDLEGTRVDTDDALRAELDAGTSPILVEAGTYTAGLSIEGELIGACPEWVVFEGAEDGVGLTVTGRVEGVTVRGAGLGGIELDGELESVVVEDALLFGVRVLDGTARLQDVEIRGTDKSEVLGGYGLEIEGSDVELVDSDIHSNLKNNVRVTESTLVVTDTSIRDGVATTNQTGGYGLFANASTVHLERALVDGSTNAGLYITGDSVVTATDSTVSNTSSETSQAAVGVDARSGSFTMSGGALLSNNGGGVVSSPGFTAELDGVEVAHNEVSAEQYVGGYGVDALTGGTLVLRNVWIHDCMAAGFLVDGAASVTVENTLIEDLRPGYTAPVAVPAFSRNSYGTLTDVELRDIRGAGLSVYGGEIVAERITIDDIRMAGMQDSGHGIEVAQAGTLRLSDSTVTNTAEAAVLCDGEGTQVFLEDVDIADITASNSKDVGLGLHAQTGCTLNAERVVVERPLFVGLGSFLAGTTMNLNDVTVLDVQVGELGEYGWGGAATHGGALHADGLTIDGSVGAGLQVATGSTATLVDTVIQNVARPAEQSSAFALSVQEDSSAEIDGLTIDAIEGPGISCAIADLSCTDCTVSAVSFSGFALENCNASIVSSSVSDVSEDASEGGGVGVFIEEPSYGPSTVRMEGTTVSDTELAAVWIQGPSAVELVGNTLDAGSVRDIGGGVEVHGDVIVARDGVSELVLSSNTIQGAAGAGLLLHASTATLLGNTWNANDTDVIQQACAQDVPDVEGIGEAGSVSVCPEYDALLLDLHFDAFLTESLPN